VHACEWNPDSVAALRHNVVALGAAAAARCTIHACDNRSSELLAAVRGIADRVNLGLLPTSELAWPIACLALKHTGGYCHVHGNCADAGAQQWVEHVQRAFTKLLNDRNSGILRDAIAGEDSTQLWSVRCVHLERVKSYAPRVGHYVADIECRPLL
jgi:tRNA G37 N-methylase Trm5